MARVGALGFCEGTLVGSHFYDFIRQLVIRVIGMIETIKIVEDKIETDDGFCTNGSCQITK